MDIFPTLSNMVATSFMSLFAIEMWQVPLRDKIKFYLIFNSLNCKSHMCLSATILDTTVPLYSYSWGSGRQVCSESETSPRIYGLVLVTTNKERNKQRRFKWELMWREVWHTFLSVFPKTLLIQFLSQEFSISNKKWMGKYHPIKKTSSVHPKGGKVNRVGCLFY